MTVYYLDSSAWLKRYFAEPGTRWVQHLFARHQPLASLRLGYVEVAAALARQRSVRPTAPDSETDLLNAFEAHWRELLKVEIDEEMPHPTACKVNALTRCKRKPAHSDLHGRIDRHQDVPHVRSGWRLVLALLFC